MRIRKKKFPSVIPGTFRVLYFAKFTHVTSGFATDNKIMKVWVYVLMFIFQNKE